MSLDPKYANLPWIAHDQPDCYEYCDLPESDQHVIQEDENNDQIDRPSLDANSAFIKFKGHNIESTNVDFSDSISKRKHTGYVVDRKEYEIVGEDGLQHETPVQKFQRLQHEVRALVDEVSAVKEGIESNMNDQPVTAAQLASLAQALQQQLSDFQLEKIIGAEATALDLSDPDGQIQKRLLQQLDSLKSKQSNCNKKATIASDSTGSVIYELHNKPANERLADTSKLGDLEQRLTRLEAMLGNNPQKLSALTADTANRSLVDAVAKLTARSSLLEPGHLDQIEARLSALNHRLQSLTERKEVLADADTQARVAELYQLVKKWDCVSEIVPQLLDRLSALRSLHEQALQFSQALTYFDSQQKSTAASLASNRDLLNSVDQRLQDNLATITRNFASLDGRLKNLGK